MSSYEERILAILKKHHIAFWREKRFSDLKKGKYRFDFYLPDYNCCIEVHGEQHWHQVKHFHKTRLGFLAQKERDRRKISYCLSHNIKLYIIPYWEVKHLQRPADIFNDKFLVRTKWHCDMIPENLTSK